MSKVEDLVSGVSVDQESKADAPLPFPIGELEALNTHESVESDYDFALRLSKIGRLLHRFVNPPDGSERSILGIEVAEENDIFDPDTTYMFSVVVPDPTDLNTQKRVIVKSTSDSFSLRGYDELKDTQKKLRGDKYDIKIDYAGEDESTLVVRVFGDIPRHREWSHTLYPCRSSDWTIKTFRPSIASLKNVVHESLKDVAFFLKTAK